MIHHDIIWSSEHTSFHQHHSTYGFVWKCWVYSQWNSHLIGIMISKTIGFRDTQHFQTHPYIPYIWVNYNDLTVLPNPGKSPFLMGKSTISMAIFHCYVSSPEGIKNAAEKHPIRLCTLNPGYPAVDPGARRRRGGGPERPRCCSMSWGDGNLKPQNPDLKSGVVKCPILGILDITL